MRDNTQVNSGGEQSPRGTDYRPMNEKYTHPQIAAMQGILNMCHT